MLEASNLVSIASVPSFFGRVFESLYGLTKTGDTTSAFIEYADGVNYLSKRHTSSEWCEASIW